MLYLQRIDFLCVEDSAGVAETCLYVLYSQTRVVAKYFLF
jgi:hypothetical protein